MKKFLAATIIFSVLFLGTPNAQAVTLEELMQEVSHLKQEIVNLKAKLTGQVLGSTLTKTFKRGMRDSEIAKYQETLIDKGYLSEGNATGFFGMLTLQALKDFQKSSGLKTDGILGPETQKALQSYEAEESRILQFCKGNTWTQKTDFGGVGRHKAVGFSIGTKGYIGTGGYNDSLGYNRYLKDFWEYDLAANTWTQKADFGGIARTDAVGFSIGKSGYIGTGYTFDFDADRYNQHVYFKDFWEYNPTTNTWVQKADFGGGARLFATGFSVGDKGYVGTGRGSDSTSDVSELYKKDFWEYNPATDTWTKKADFGGGARMNATGFSVLGKGYVGTGYIVNGSQFTQKDFWEYNPATDTWTKKADFGGGGRSAAMSFNIGSKGYIGTGNNLKDFWEYNPATDTWTKKADFGGGARWGAVGFSIGGKGYAGTGTTTTGFWEYCPTQFETTPLPDLPL